MRLPLNPENLLTINLDIPKTTRAHNTPGTALPASNSIHRGKMPVDYTVIESDCQGIAGKDSYRNEKRRSLNRRFLWIGRSIH
jgi:hypothetical protein